MVLRPRKKNVRALPGVVLRGAAAAFIIGLAAVSLYEPRNAGPSVMAYARSAPEGPVAPYLKVVAVGDVSLARGVQTAIDEGRDPFDGTRELISDASVAICNLECALTDEDEHIAGKGPFGGKIFLAGRPDDARLLTKAGFDVACLANNHTMDYGPAGLEDTVEALRAAGLGYCGAGATESGALTPVRFGSRGFTVACLAFNEVEPRSYAAAGDRPGVAWADEATVLETVKKVSGDVDVLILSFHWGTEGVREPTRAQRELARSAACAGADIIIGHHPHIVGPVETYGRAVIAYSLGNFVFDTVYPKRRDAAVLSVYVGRKTGVVGYSVIPARIRGVSPQIPNYPYCEVGLPVP